MKKLDLKNEYANLYKASAQKIEIITVPEFKYLMCDGYGEPHHSKLFQDIAEALSSLSYTIKFMLNNNNQQLDYGVLPLEVIWWADDMNDLPITHKEDWKWTLMIMQPDFITCSIVELAKEQLKKKKILPALDMVQFGLYEDGLCAQTLHIGPYNDESPAIIKLHDFIKDNEYKPAGKHRKIYLSDMRRTAPEKLKTIIRQPVKNKQPVFVSSEKVNDHIFQYYKV